MRAGAVLAAVIASFGCSTAPRGGAAPPDDALQVDAVADVGVDATIDAIDARADGVGDVRDAAADRGRDATEAGDADTDDASDATTDVVIDPGMCGPGVRACVCECGGTGPCVNMCVAADLDCGGCLYTAASRCCPDENRLFEECIDRNMCADDGCVRLRCSMEQRRFETCFAAAQMSEEVCRREMRTCLGSDFPMIRCVRKE